MVYTPADVGAAPVFVPTRWRRKPVYHLFTGRLDELATASGRGRLIVTPNTDHLRLLSRSRAFRRAYARADVVLNDSRALDRAFIHGQAFCLTGADLAREMIDRAPAGGRLQVIGFTPAVQAALARRRPDLDVRYLNPSMGYINKRAERRALVGQVKAAEPQVVLVCTGAPQSEIFAAQLKRAGTSADILCCGSGLLFLAGAASRAPAWMQVSGLEWLWRAISEPRTRGRYLKDLIFILANLRALLGLSTRGVAEFRRFRLRARV